VSGLARRVLLAGLAALAVTAARGQTAASAPPAAKRAQFVYVLRVVPRFHDRGAWTEVENRIVASHFRRLVAASDAGLVLMAGRTSEPLDRTFGIVVFEAADADEARRFMEGDPAVEAGLMTATLHPYFVAVPRRR